MVYGVTVIGLGFVGLTTAAFFADRRIKTYGIDSNVERIKSIKEKRIPFFEPKLDQFVNKALLSQMLDVDNELSEGIKNSKYIFITVGTPMGQGGKANLTNITQVSKSIGSIIKELKKYRLICVKSTVPPETTEKIIIPLIEKTSTKLAYRDFGIVFVPEFLREGSAIEDTTNPHKIVIGSNDTKSLSYMDSLIARTYGTKINVIKTNIISAELIKYANNAFLATKISFINTIANICNHLRGADVDIIARAIGTDPRIGNQFLVAGPGYGGSCLPKDLSALIMCCKKTGYDPVLLKAIEAVNKDQIKIILNILSKRLGTINGKAISILGLAFKKDTDDIRESVSIRLIRELKNVANVTVHDPKALDNTKKIFGHSIRYANSIKNALIDTDCVIIMTDWDGYKKITQKDLDNKKNRRIVVLDTRRILNLRKTNKVDYLALGNSAFLYK